MARLPHQPTDSKSPYSRAADPELVRDCLHGHAAAWDALINRYAALIYALCLRSGLSQADAEDTFQNVCVLLLEHLPDLRDTRRLAGWLVSTTQRACWRVQSRKRPQLASELGDGEWAWESAEGAFAARPDSPEKDVIELENQQMIREALARLPERCNRLLNLLYNADTPPEYRDIAALLAMPVGSVGPTRARCLQTLRKLLDELGY